MRRAFVPGLGFLLVSALVAAPASAATFVVDSRDDVVDAAPGNGTCATAGGACTLRAAIQEANALGGADRIVLGRGVHFLAIGGSGEDAAATGDLDITEDLAIAGRGAALTYVNARGLDRVFHAIGAVVVRFSGLTIQNGVSASSGGGLYSDGATVFLNGCNVSNNMAAFPTTGVSGGGIFAAGGSLTVTGGAVSGNIAASSSATGYGGGLDAFGATVVLAGTKMTGNAASGATACGGGFRALESAVTLRRATVSSNRVLAGMSLGIGTGGGVCFAGNPTLPLRILSSTVSGNSAGSIAFRARGGGIFIQGVPGASYLVSDSVIAGNSAVGQVPDGGGITAIFGGALTIRRGSRITGNSSGGAGGGIFRGDPTVLTVSADSTVTRNIPDNIAP